MADQNDLTKSLESRVILKRPWKLIMPYSANNDEEIELFNIIEDPAELNNLSKDHPDVVRELTGDLDKFWDPGK
jgi:uncharacterized sulfatase